MNKKELHKTSMIESKFQTKFNQYLRESKMLGYFELKVVNTETFLFSKLENNQIEGLSPLEKNGLIWKLSDEDSRLKPCDCFSAPPMPSYLVLIFKDGFYLIRFSKIERMMYQGRVGIKKEDVEKEAELIIKFNK